MNSVHTHSRVKSEFATRCSSTTSLTAFCLTLLVVCVVGCRSSKFRAGNLPANYRVSHQKEKQNIDLAKISSRGTSKAIISPSDLLEITLATGRTDEEVTPTLARVADDGSVDVPIVGPVPVAGMEAYDASRNITNLAIQRGMFRNPLVTVEIKSKAVNRVTILGAVDEPGVHEIPRGSCDLISALAASGGLTENASPTIEIIRQPSYQLADNSTTPLNPEADANGEVQLASYQQQGSNPQGAPQGGWTNAQTIQLDLTNKQPTGPIDFQLRDRDIVRVVPRKEEMIYVTGLVEEPGQFALPATQDVHLLDAVALAGGKSSPVADKVFVIRRIENREEPIVIQASLSEAKGNGLENLRLKAGDTVSIEQTPATVVIDTIGKFFRLSFGVATSTIF